MDRSVARLLVGFRWVSGLFALLVLAAFLDVAPPATAATIGYYNRGLRWIGRAPTCVAPPNWVARRLFSFITTQAPAVDDFCSYTWKPRAPIGDPSAVDVADLRRVSGAAIVEDVPVLRPMWSNEQLSFYDSLRGALRERVGTAALLPSWPARPVARIAVIDTAPDAIHGAIRPGSDRHGDTLAHIIRDLVCDSRASGTPCAVEVTTTLAMPWQDSGEPSTGGGNVGSPIDLALAVERATKRWEDDLLKYPSTTPRRLILNLSVGWEDTPGIADCPTDPLAPVKEPAAAVQLALQVAAAKGALIYAAAGNDSGGPFPRTGLTCPGAYQALGQTERSWLPLLTAVSAVDYADRPLEISRKHGLSALAAPGLGGIGWGPLDAAPIPLTGTSLSTAVASAIAALVWTARPEWSADQVRDAVYGGGLDLGDEADECPLAISSCRHRRASVCGALRFAGVASSCATPGRALWSSPALPAQFAALIAWFTPLGQPLTATPAPQGSISPRYQRPSMQVEPWTFPMPISVTCPTCWVSSSSAAAPGATLSMPSLGRTLHSPRLVLRLEDESAPEFDLGPVLNAGESYSIELPLQLSSPIRAATINGFDQQQQYSVTEQLFIHR